jgi:hypothetical protein
VAGDKDAVHPNLLGAIFGLAVKFHQSYDAVFKLYNSITVADQKVIF